MQLLFGEALASPKYGLPWWLSGADLSTNGGGTGHLS